MRKRTATAVLGGVLLVGAAACGGPAAGGGSHAVAASPGAALDAAYTTTTAAHTARMMMTMAVTTAGHDLTITSSGAADFAQHTVEMTTQLPGAGEMQERVVGSTVYLQLPAAVTGHLPVRTPWVSVNIASLSKLAGVSPTGLSGFSDPRQVLSVLRQRAQSVHADGPATVDGVATTKYSAVFRPAALAGELAAGSPAASALSQMGDVPVTVWVDHTGRMRQMTMALTLPAQAGGGHVAVTIDMNHFGVPVSVTAPPAGQVTDISGMLARQQSA